MSSGTRRAWGTTMLLLAPLLLALAAAWSPPPPEFPDVRAGSGMRAVMKWEPTLGEPSSLLDLLPPGAPAAGDFNRDGFSDLFVPSPSYTNASLAALRAPTSRLYMNDGSSVAAERFLDVTDVAGIQLTGFAYAASWGDYDNDGWIDLFVGGWQMARLYRNTADGAFTDVTLAAGIPQDGLVLGGAWGDHDRDGRADLLLTRFTHDPSGARPLDAYQGASNALLRNRGDGTFEDVSAASGMAAHAARSTGASFVDADSDGWLDAFVTNLGEPNELWRNRGDGTFEERASALGLGDPRGATAHAWEDLDGDGRLDLALARATGPAVALLAARAEGGFSNHSTRLGPLPDGAAWGIAAIDHDGDGDMDLFAARAGIDGTLERGALFLRNGLRETGSAFFEDVTAEAGDGDIPGYGSPTVATPAALGGATTYDWNLDGAPDLAAAPSDATTTHLYKNVGWAGGWVGGSGDSFKVWLTGNRSNAAGLGALVTVEAGNIRVTRQLGAAMGGGGQSLTELHFGLMKAAEGGYAGVANPVNVTIRWPSGQVDEHVGMFNVNQKKTVRFLEGAGWQNDTMPPRPAFRLVAGSQLVAPWYSSASVKLQITAADTPSGGSTASGIVSLRYSLDGVTWTDVTRPTTTGATLSFAGEGTHRVWVQTLDRAGNVGRFLYPVRLDATAPSVALRDPAENDLILGGERAASGAPTTVVVGSGPVRVVAEASDAASGVRSALFQLVRTNGHIAHESRVDLAPYDWVWAADATAAGEHRLVITVTDHAGHTSTLARKLVVIPATAEGGEATAEEGVSLPSPP